VIRLLSISLLFLYLISTAGVRFQAHYCHGEFSSFTFNPFHELSCGCDDESTMDSCCDEAQFALKIQDSHASTSSSTCQLSAHYSESFPTNFEVRSFLKTPKNLRFNNKFHDLKPPDRCIAFGQFRI
jgi:hypothetical protein